MKTTENTTTRSSVRRRAGLRDVGGAAAETVINFAKVFTESTGLLADTLVGARAENKLDVYRDIKATEVEGLDDFEVAIIEQAKMKLMGN